MICTFMALGPGLGAAGVKVSDITLHLFAFIYLSAALSIAHLRSHWLRVALWLLLYGALIEIAQSQLPARQAEWKDLGIDVFGIGVGLVAYRLIGERVWSLFLRVVGLRAQPDKS
jgi:VanZ family protein